MAAKFTFKQFQAQYPDDDACLDSILSRRYVHADACPHCGVIGKLSRIDGRRAYACKEGCHVYPCAGTVFEKSTTVLTLWFHAMYLMSATRNGVSAKELQRKLGVTYKCAWRIGHQLRTLMGAQSDREPPLSRHTEVDEAYIGGRQKGVRGRGAKGKTIVVGILERAGRIMAKVVENVTRNTLETLIETAVAPGSVISTDEFRSYNHLSELGYVHGTVSYGAGEYVSGIHHVNGVEGFWSHLKRGIRSTHVAVSPKHLQKYVEEFGFRYNNCAEPGAMFERMVDKVSIPTC